MNRVAYSIVALFVAVIAVQASTSGIEKMSWMDARIYLENHPALRLNTHRTKFPLVTEETFTEPSYWFDQKLDHFTNNPATWKQRYQVNSTYWAPGNPIFIFLDGEAPINFFQFQEVSAWDWAKQFGAMYISLEHRFYGESLPFKEFSTNNLKYLSSQQALADAALFIQEYNATIKNPGPWVVWGCSYSGALSAWFRAKYPNSVVASIAPSGPVYALTNFTAYYGQFEQSAKMEGFDTCVTAVQQGVAQISNLLSTPSGVKQLEQTFNTCKPLNPNEYWYFKNMLMGQVGGSDQMDNPPDWPLNATCAIMTNGTNYVQNWANTFGSGKCNDFEEQTFINLMRLEIPNANRAWMWQQCTEFGFFMPSYPGTSIFWDDIPLEPLVGWCEQIYGIKNMTPDTNWTNTYYGGYDLQATNVMFTNGLLDPWHNLSINQNQSPGVSAVTYQAGHCAPMDAPSPEDPPSLVQARTQVQAFLTNVLKPYTKNPSSQNRIFV